VPDGSEANDANKGAVITRLLDAVWRGVILGDSKWNPNRSCYDLATEYGQSGRTPDECVANFIKWQTAKAGGAGFVLGLPGLTFGIVTIPADLAYTTYLQLRMVAVIALLYGWDSKSDRLKTLAFLSMLGSGAAEAARAFGIQVGTKLTGSLFKKIPGRVLIEINKAVGFRLVTKAGTTGAVNLVKLVPIIGGVVSGGMNATTTRTIGLTARSILKDGPGPKEDSSAADPALAGPFSSEQVRQPGNLTKTEQVYWLRLLQAWLPLDDFEEALERLEAVQGDQLMTDPRAGFYRDAFCALQFATLAHADQVRLIRAERPDFEIGVGGAVSAFEVTEADTPGRKRGHEIQEKRTRRVPGQPLVEDFPVEDWLTPEQADVALRTAAEKKCHGNYHPHCGLVILLNPIEFGIHQQAIETLMADATAAARNRFASVWVLWKGVGYNTWRNGERGSERLMPHEGSPTIFEDG